MNRFYFLLIVFLVFSQGISFAGDIRAGNIRVEQLSAKTVRATVNIYTQIHATAPQLELCWGDGACEDWSTSKVAEWPKIDTRHFQMQTYHEYGQAGMIDIAVNSCCWASDLNNLSSSETVTFELKTSFLVGDEQNGFLNTTPEIDPYFSICSTSACTHSPQIVDQEGDDLTWNLCAPDLSVYYELKDLSIDPSSHVSFDSASGNLVWVNLPYEGLFAHVTCLTEERDDAIISESQYFTLLVVNNSLPVKEPDVLVEFSLAPNPANDFLQLKNIPASWKNSKSLIYNTWGQLVYQQQGIRPIDLSQWTAGFYYLVLEKKGKRAVRRFVKRAN